MQGKWQIGFFLALGILTLIAILGEPLGAMLGILVLFCAAAFAVVASHIVFVQQRTAMIVQSQQHDAVLRVVTGPDRIFLLPCLEKLAAVMDTGHRLEQVHVQDALQSDQQPATFRFTAFVLHETQTRTRQHRVGITLFRGLLLDCRRKPVTPHRRTEARCYRSTIGK